MPDENTKLNIVIDLKQANIVLTALADQPWRIANDLIIAIRNQMMDQLNPPQTSNNVTQFATGGGPGAD
jgi:hypothetical protein